jgi:hypothetical protein
MSVNSRINSMRICHCRLPASACIMFYALRLVFNCIHAQMLTFHMADRTPKLEHSSLSFARVRASGVKQVVTGHLNG